MHTIQRVVRSCCLVALAAPALASLGCEAHERVAVRSRPVVVERPAVVVERPVVVQPAVVVRPAVVQERVIVRP